MTAFLITHSSKSNFSSLRQFIRFIRSTNFYRSGINPFLVVFKTLLYFVH